MFRIGFGYDLHKFVINESPNATESHIIRLCATDVEHKYKIEAHSDGDVVLHAVVDAMLGAIAEKDIGHHFPPSDKKWQDADSKNFLEYTAKLMNEKHYRIGNIDITIVCERPKISPYREKMRENIANILQIEVDRVSVKAKTNEKMDSIGQGFAISAYAIIICYKK